MVYEEILKIVFPFLKCIELARCMLVCKQWRDIAQDDYFWKCLCSKKWPSIVKWESPPTLSYYELFKAFYRRYRRQWIVPPPRLSFNDLEFHINIWVKEKLIFSDVVQGHVLQKGTWIPPPGISDALRLRLERPECKMILPVEPRFNIPYCQKVSVSVFVGRKDTRKLAWIIKDSSFGHVDRRANLASVSDYVDISSPFGLFYTSAQARASLLFMDNDYKEAIDVFAIEMDFSDAANTEDKALWLLDMLDWR